MKKIQFLIVCFLWFTPLFGVELQIFDSPDALAEAVAREIADSIHQKPRTVLGLATGSTPIPVYRDLIQIAHEENLDFSEVITFNLDEYADLPLDHPNSYHTFMDEFLFNSFPTLNIEHIHFPSQDHPAEYEEQIAREGPIDIQILGIGTNGHIGFAEPGTTLEGHTELVRLTENTRKDNARFFGDDIRKVPQYAVTMGIKTILGAKKIYLLATGKNKAKIIKALLEEEISSNIPATALKMHSNTKIYLDKEAASMLKVTHFTNGRVLKDHHISDGDLWICGGKIIAPQSYADNEIDVKGLLIAPGYIDLQINGGFGIDFSKQPEELENVAEKLPKFGVTAFLPTIISCTKEQYGHILSTLRPAVMQPLRGATVLGIHLEGPFFNPNQRGAHCSHHLLDCEEMDSPRELYGDLSGVKMVTLAPELPGALKTIELLRNEGIIVSAGHTSPSVEQMQDAIEKGLGFASHLFNAMGSFHHRNPGIIGSVLIHPKIPFSLIGDRHHVHPHTVMFAWHANSEGLILISDAMAALGLPSGQYSLGDLNIEVNTGKAVVFGTETLAGSVVSLGDAVRYLHASSGCSHAEAIEAASYKPAKLLGLEGQKGSLHVGADADFNLLDDALNVQACYIAGKCRYNQIVGS